MKLLATVLFTACIGLSAFSQTTFQKTLGSSGDDLSYNWAILPDGNLVATGTTNSVPNQGWDTYLVKLTPMGELIWGKTYGGTGDETTWDIIVTQSGDIVSVGHSTSLGTPHRGATIAKADTSGAIVWLTGVNDMNGTVDFYRVLETSTGHFLATGLLTTTANQDVILLCKFSASGTLLWSKTVGSAQNDEIMGLTETPDGHYLLAGLTNDVNGNGGSDFAAVKTDTSGTVIWKKNYGGTGSDRLNDVVVIGAHYYFLGFSSSVGQGSADFVLMKTDTAGTVDWVKAYGSPVADRVFNLLFDESDSTLMLAGYTDYSSGTNNRNTLLLKVDMNGDMVWDKSYGSNQRDGHWPTGVLKTNDKGFYIFGNANSFSTNNVDDLYFIKTDDLGNTSCLLKDPQFVQTNVTGWTATNFGTAGTASLLSFPIPLTGAVWSPTGTTHCCELYAFAGPDTTGCPMDSIELGTPALPGYEYTWTHNGTPVSTDALLKIDFADSGMYVLQVAAPGSNCSPTADTVMISAHPAPAKPTITTTMTPPFILNASAADFYQWFLNGDTIPGATQQDYTATQSGSYQVMVTNQFGCSQMSDPISLTIGLKEDWFATQRISVFPNPTSGSMTLRFELPAKEITLRIYTLSGKLVHNENLPAAQSGEVHTLDISNLPSGVYLLQVVHAEGTGTTKVLRE